MPPVSVSLPCVSLLPGESISRTLEIEEIHGQRLDLFQVEGLPAALFLAFLQNLLAGAGVAPEISVDAEGGHDLGSGESLNAFPPGATGPSWPHGITRTNRPAGMPVPGMTVPKLPGQMET